MRLALFLLVLLFSATLPALATKTIMVMGDSLSAGYGIRPEQAWPSLLAKRLTEKRLDYSVANLSISGETTAGGRSRLSQALRQYKPAIVVIALGANDGLRGLALAQMRDNLNAMIDAARAAAPRCCWPACACRPTTALMRLNSSAALAKSPAVKKLAC
jgi:acyl-CoA thioesterase-1